MHKYTIVIIIVVVIELSVQSTLKTSFLNNYTFFSYSSCVKYSVSYNLPPATSKEEYILEASSHGDYIQEQFQKTVWVLDSSHNMVGSQLTKNSIIYYVFLSTRTHWETALICYTRWKRHSDREGSSWCPKEHKIELNRTSIFVNINCT